MTPRGTPFRTWNDYFIPGTSVLRNKLGESDQSKLTAMEEAITAVRLGELRENPIAGRFDYDHMKAIHKHVFQRPERPPRDEP